MFEQEQPTVIHTVKKRHSFYTTANSEKSSCRSVCKSEANIHYNYNTGLKQISYLDKPNEQVNFQEYYKHYDHDEIPVKDENSFNDHSFSEDNDLITGDNIDSITNSDLDKLEMKILRKMSQELLTHDTSVSSLDSNIKLFKTTVQQIFNSFYTNMQDFEVYKKKFNDILEKNKGDSFSEMEDFIRDMIQNIVSSDSSMSNKKIEISSIEDMKKSNDCRLNVNNNMANRDSSVNSTMETYLNDNYLTDSTFENNSSKRNVDVKREETFNIYLLSGNPCLEIKMTNRDMLSEINIRDQNFNIIENQLASAENLQKLAAKKLQLENYANQQQECLSKDRNIPVRLSNPKKNIHLNQDFTCNDQEKEESKFFIFKICNYICKKLRKNSIN